MAKVSEIKVGYQVAFNNLKNAVWFDVMAIDGFHLTIREHGTNFANQFSDKSLVKQIRQNLKGEPVSNLPSLLKTFRVSYGDYYMKVSVYTDASLYSANSFYHKEYGLINPGKVEATAKAALKEKVQKKILEIIDTAKVKASVKKQNLLTEVEEEWVNRYEVHERILSEVTIILAGNYYFDPATNDYVMDRHIKKFLPEYRVMSHSIDHHNSEYLVIMEKKG